MLVRAILGKLVLSAIRKKPENAVFSRLFGVVEVTGFEPATFWSRRAYNSLNGNLQSDFIELRYEKRVFCATCVYFLDTCYP